MGTGGRSILCETTFLEWGKLERLVKVDFGNDLIEEFFYLEGHINLRVCSLPGVSRNSPTFFNWDILFGC